MLELKLGRLKSNAGAVLPFTLSADFQPARYGYEALHLAAPLLFQGSAENRGEAILVDGSLQAQLLLPCSRCGKDFTAALELPFQEIYTWQEAGPDLEGEQDIYHFEGDVIDLTPEALRQIFLELPMQPLCRADCRGLCPQCGQDLNQEQCSCAEQAIDPRWQKLQAFMEEKRGVTNGRTEGEDLEGE